MYKYLVRILIGANVVGIIVAAVTCGIVQSRKNAVLQERISAGNSMEVSGSMIKGDYLQLQSIAEGINRTGGVPDKDLDWMVALMGRPLRERNADIVNVNVLAALAGLKTVSGSQKDKIYKVTVAMLTVNDPNDQLYELDKQFAARMQEHIKDTRTIPYLLPLLDNPKEGVKNRAQLALAAMGYKQ